NELEHHFFLQLAADDAVLHHDRLGAHDDNVIDEMMDHVEGDGGGAAMLEGDFLLGAGLFGFHDQDGFFDAGEGGVEKGGEGAGAMQDARVFARTGGHG